MKLTQEEIRLSMNRDTYNRSLTLYAQQAVGRLELKASSHYTCVTAPVISRGRYSPKVTIENNTGAMSTDCDCIEHQAFGMCPHVGALLIKYCNATQKPDRQVRAESNKEARALLNIYAPELPAPEAKVALQPLLNTESDVPALAFKIGNSDGMFIIKDLIDYAHRMEQKGSFVYGTRFEFEHDPAALDEDSKFWNDFICSRTAAFESAVKQSGHRYVDRLDLRELPLNGRDFDLVFEHLLPSGHIANRNAGRRFTLKDADPDIALRMTEENGAYQLSLSATPRIIRGAAHDYALVDADICRMTPDYAEAMVPLLRAVTGNNLPVFSRDGAKEFCMNVLPAVDKYVKGSDLKVLDDIRPEDLEVSYLIDMPERSRLTASVSFHYGTRYVDSAASDRDYPDIRRNLNQEKTAIRALEQFFDPPQEPGGLYEITDEERIYDFLRTGTEQLAHAGQVFVTDRLKNIDMARPVRPSVSLKLDGGILEFGVDTGEFPREELAQLMRSVREKRRYYRLRDGRFMGLENGAMGSFTQTVDALGLKDSDLEAGIANLPAYRALFMDSAFKDGRDVQSVEKNSSFKRLIRDFKTVEDSDFEVPQALDKVLRPYQKHGFRWLRTLDAYKFGGILADDMGLGKTLQVLTYLQSLKDEGKLTHGSLIVCPASLVLNWGDEAQKWTPELRTCLLTSGDPHRNHIFELAEQYDIIVTSYDLMRRDIEAHAKSHYYACILDEAQYIKNQETISARSVRRINADVHFALTGTPVENRLSELWSIFEFIMPGYLGSYSKFRDHFEKPIYGGGDPQTQAAAKAALSGLVHPFILRRMKTDVLDELPPKSEMNCYIEMEETQRKYYLAYVQDIKDKLENAGPEDRMKILAMLTRLRQLCCDPALCVEHYEGGSAKLEECLRMAEELIDGGHRILIFSQFTSMLARIEARLESMGIQSFTLKGDTPLPERASLVKRFNAGEVPVFLISLKAGGTGLNLTGADTVFHYDPWWNIAAQNQATDRCYRIGQDKAVTVYKLIAKDSIEENIIKLQDMKLDLAKVVNENTDGGLMNMTKEQLMDLLSYAGSNG